MSPTIVLRIVNGEFHIHRAFPDFAQAEASAEAFAAAGNQVTMFSATGQILMLFAAQARTH